MRLTARQTEILRILCRKREPVGALYHNVDARAEPDDV